eukprot:CAMPEP_0172730410 /NCGR_PEP_ID=MMETSP1074-20121228/98021_1 /TAXON_ID=2916 /ORGANISM="Ceratium fusus, Strain PA161109" /LENGTH=209 /DNA_ID=CAMNT_0013558131 /DNA_START=203 /DNA_END=832 /DNA_ORIENTATION=+
MASGSAVNATALACKFGQMARSMQEIGSRTLCMAMADSGNVMVTFTLGSGGGIMRMAGVSMCMAMVLHMRGNSVTTCRTDLVWRAGLMVLNTWATSALQSKLDLAFTHGPMVHVIAVGGGQIRWRAPAPLLERMVAVMRDSSAHQQCMAAASTCGPMVVPIRGSTWLTNVMALVVSMGQASNGNGVIGQQVSCVTKPPVHRLKLTPVVP